jgi:alpha-tubulin suppressor-like RCC1 family protein
MTTWGWGNAVAASGFGNATLTRPAPATVPGAVDFVMVGGNNNGDGTGGSLWLSTAGEVYFAGTNSSGGYGDGTALSSGISHTSPVQVPGLSDIVKISMGGRAYYALASDGTLYGWGTNQFGQLAHTVGTNFLTPVVVATGVVDFDSFRGETLIILQSGGVIKTVGFGSEGQRADGTTIQNQGTFQTVTPSGSAVIRVVNGFSFSMVIRADGSVLAAGTNTQATGTTGGALGVTTTGAHSNWFTLPYTNAVEGGAGARTSYVIKNDGTLWSMGLNENGQLGVGFTQGTVFTNQVSTPTQWVNPGGVTISQAMRHYASTFHVLGTNGKIYTAGGNGAEYARGDGTQTGNTVNPAWANGLTGQLWVGMTGLTGLYWAGDQVLGGPAPVGLRGFAAVIG